MIVSNSAAQGHSLVPRFRVVDQHPKKCILTASFFTVYTNGELWLNYGALTNRLERPIIAEFHNSIHEMPSFQKIPADFSKWPSIELSDAFLNQPDALEKFKAAVEALGRRVHSKE